MGEDARVSASGTRSAPAPHASGGSRRRWSVALAWAWAAVAGTVFLVLATTRGIPVGPEGAVIARDLSQRLHLVVLAMVLAGLLVGLRRPAAGAWPVIVAALALGVLATVEYALGAAFLLAVAFLVPGLLLLAADQPGRTPRATAGVATAVVVLLAAGGLAADRVHDRAFGPFHPTSRTPALPAVSVRWVWSGAPTPQGFRVVARLVRPRADARLLVARRGDLADARAVDAGRADADGVVSLRAAGLDVGTTYHYAVEVDGRRDDPRVGRVRTLPRGPASFTIAVASCATTGSNGVVFDAIRRLDPLLYVQTGDLFYANVDVDSDRRFLRAYDRTLSAPAQAALYRTVPVAYVWDDHDYGTNDADARSPSRRAAMRAYRRLVPHAPLALPGADAPIGQALTVGRVRLILTDNRSARSPAGTSDSAAKSMLGRAQRRWLLAEAAAATRRGELPVWVNPVPWIAARREGGDDWSGYATERRRIADALRERGVRSLVMLSGDAHMVALDDGSHSGYATGGGPGFPVLHAAALDEAGAVRGGPYSEGAHSGAGQYGIMRVEDDGGAAIRVTLEGRDWRGRRLVALTTTLPVAPAGTPPPRGAGSPSTPSR